jgi:hypothetical protein
VARSSKRKYFFVIAGRQKFGGEDVAAVIGVDGVVDATGERVADDQPSVIAAGH